MALNNQDVFKRFPVHTASPITADGCIIRWGNAGDFLAATNLAIQHSQQVTRRRTLGNINGQTTAVLFASQPQGTITIGRLLAEGSSAGLFTKPGWNACDATDIEIEFVSGSLDCSLAGPLFTCKGCVVESYSLQAESEGQTVMDNVVIQFLQLTHQNRRQINRSHEADLEADAAANAVAQDLADDASLPP